MGNSVQSSGGWTRQDSLAISTTGTWTIFGALQFTGAAANGDYPVVFSLWNGTFASLEIYQTPPDDGSPNRLVYFHQTSAGASDNDIFTGNGDYYGDWIHFAFVYDGSNGIKAYLLKEGFNPASPSYLFATSSQSMKEDAGYSLMQLFNELSNSSVTIATNVKVARFGMSAFAATESEVLAQFAQRALTSAFSTPTNIVLDMDAASTVTDDTGSANDDWSFATGFDETDFSTQTDAPSEWSILPVGLATETDTALAPSGEKRLAVGLATETDTAFSLYNSHTLPVGLATEADAALAPALAKQLAPGIATETSTALAPAILKQAAAGISAETETALAPVAARPELLLSASSNGRYFENAYGDPVFLQGDTWWHGAANLTDEEWETICADRKAKGFNFVIVEIVQNVNTISTPPQDVYGNEPWIGTALQSGLNEPYWLHIDAKINIAGGYGLIVLFFVVYEGYPSAGEGFETEVNAAGDANMQTYGGYIGARYKLYDNIIYCAHGDNPNYASRYDALVTGIKSADTRHTLFTSHFTRFLSAHDKSGGVTFETCDFVYAGDTNWSGTPAYAPAYEEAEESWNAAIGPGVLIEASYTDAGELLVRTERSQAVLAGCLGGSVVGIHNFWQFAASPAWEGYIDTAADVQAKHFGDFIRALPWHRFEPEFQADTDLITAGRGTYGNDDWAAAAGTPDRRTVVVHIPDGASKTIALSEFPDVVIARWYDQTNGNYTAASGSPLANTGTHAFVASSEVGNNSAGDPDWLLLLESPFVVGLATETDTALALAASEQLAPGIATEVSTALAVTGSKSIAVGVATETDVALELAASELIPAGLATETDSAIAPTGEKRLAVGLATETDEAFSLYNSHELPVGLAAETDAALSLAAREEAPTGLAAETDSALAPTAAKQLTPGIATETSTALGLTGEKHAAPAVATETDSAFSRYDSTHYQAPGVASESSSAMAPAASKQTAMGLAATVDVAVAVQLSKVLSVALAATTDQALAPGQSVQLAVGRADELSTALGLSAFERLTPGLATETDTAMGPFDPPPLFGVPILGAWSDTYPPIKGTWQT